MDKCDIDCIASGEPTKVGKSLNTFTEKYGQTFTFKDLNTSGQWPIIWNAVFDILEKPQSTGLCVQCLSTIRILSRDKTPLNETINSKQFDCLLNIAQIGPKNELYPTNVSTEALKCLCNLLFNSKVCQDLCLHNCAAEEIVKRIGTYKDNDIEYEIQYFDMKLLFLITALNPATRPKVRQDYSGFVHLVEILELIVGDNGSSEGLSDKQLDFLNEILKVLFNLTVLNAPAADRNSDDSKEKTQLRRLATVLQEHLLCNTISAVDKKHEFISNVVNLLTNIPIDCYNELIPTIDNNSSVAKEFKGRDMSSVDVLIDFMRYRLSTMQSKFNAQSEYLSPVLTAMVKSARCNSIMRQYLRSVILPPLVDVTRKPEDGDELRNYLCRLLTTPSTQVRDLVAELLFVICKENVGRMIKYTGYGNAAGLFANRGLLGGHNNTRTDEYSSSSEDSDTEEYKQLQHGINPVLGCFEPKRPDPLEGMTDEQKEYEAMKLVTLMDRLHRQGIVQPCRIGDDGRPEPVNHILELQTDLPQQQQDHKRKT